MIRTTCCHALVLMIVSAASGCGGHPEVEHRDEVIGADSLGSLTCDASAEPAAGLPLEFEICSKRRWIVYLGPTDPVCEERLAGLSGWAVSRLFPGVDVPELARYCVLEWLGAHPPADPTDNGPLFGLDAQADCEVVTPQAEPWDSYLTHFRTQVDPWRPRKTALPLNVAPTRLALIDGAEGYNSGAPRVDRSGHAFALGRLAEDLTCTSTSHCTTALDHHLALTLIGSNPMGLIFADADGGYFGRISDLSTAIVDAVEAWRHQDIQEHLVVNISAGWLDRSDLAGWDPVPSQVRALPSEKKNAAARSVMAALAYAACKGTLVFGASGNQTGGANLQNGALYPAGWEEVDAPRKLDCRDHFGDTDLKPLQLIDRPLIHAVSAVDHAHRPVTNARPSSRAPLAAPGHLAVSTGVSSVERTRILTGSSVASLITAATVAQIWALEPDLGPRELMNQVYQKSIDMGFWPDFGHPTRMNRPARALSMCQVTRQIVKHEDFPSGRCGKTPVRGLNVPDSHFSGFEDRTPANHVFQFQSTGICIPDVCDGMQVLSDPVASFPCPTLQRHTEGAQPMTGPQPTDNPCPHCIFQASAQKLYLEFEDSPLEIGSAPVLVVYSGTETLAVELTEIGIPEVGEPYIVEDLDLGDAIKSAYISVVDADESLSVLAPIHVE